MIVAGTPFGQPDSGMRRTSGLTSAATPVVSAQTRPTGSRKQMSLARARALAIVGVLVLAALVLVVAAIVKDRQSNASYANGGCKAGDVRITVNPLPRPSQIKLNVYNGTGEPNPDPVKRQKQPVGNAGPKLGSVVAERLRHRHIK